MLVSSPEALMEKLTVLVIDDNTNHGEGLVELLELNGFTALQATTGAAGLQLAAEFPIDAVLLDIHLPDMTGLDVCRTFRSNPSMEQTAIIFHTGSSSFYGSEHGADAFLTYPVAISELCAVIVGSVYRRKGNHENDAPKKMPKAQLLFEKDGVIRERMLAPKLPSPIDET